MNSPEPVFSHRHTRRYGKDLTPVYERESYYYGISGKGVIEGWRSPELHPELAGRSHYGGIEVHSLTPLYDGHTSMGKCTVLGGDCYHDGSSLAYDNIEHHFDTPGYIRDTLAEWAKGRLQ